MFKISIGDDVKGNIHRERFAVRAVISKGDKLLMVKNKFGDYKFPGGGIEPGEKTEIALKREILEETGYSMKSCLREVGSATERYKDGDGIFQMISRYFICEITDDEPLTLDLDDYEEKLGFCAEWIHIEECLNINRGILYDQEKKALRWVNREVLALKHLIEMFRNQ